MVIQSKKVWLADQFVPAAIEVNDGRITAILPYGTKDVDDDYGDKRIVPGFMDIHCHGAYEFDTNAANEDGLMVWGKSGKSQFFPFEKLDHVLDGERIFVAMFAEQGVTIPKDTFVRGDAEQFGSFLKARINKKLRIETKRKKMKAEKAAAKAKQESEPKNAKAKQRKQKKNKKKR